MAFPTCNRTMQGIGQTTDGRRHFWCPCCGTLRSVAGNHADTGEPTIVQRARDLLDYAEGLVTELPEFRNLREAATGRPDR